MQRQGRRGLRQPLAPASYRLWLARQYRCGADWGDQDDHGLQRVPRLAVAVVVAVAVAVAVAVVVGCC